MTGSRIAAVMGFSPFESRFSLWHRMAGNLGDVEVTSAMEWGNWLEAIVLDKFVERRRDELLDVHVVGSPGTFRHSRRRRQVANPDGLAFDARDGRTLGVIEVKTSRYGDEFAAQPSDWTEPANDAIPPHYLMQLCWYLDTFGLDYGVLTVLIGGNETRDYTIARDPDLCRRMRAEGNEFLDTLDRDERPDIDDHGATYEAIKEMHPEIETRAVEIAESLAKFAAKAKDDKARADAAMTLARSRIADAMGNAKWAQVNKRPVADRRTKGTGRPYVQLDNRIKEFL